jgi:hypothetical protein
MDTQRFDRLTRAISACASRRQAVGLLAAIAMAGRGPRAASAAQVDASALSCDAGLTYCPDAGACVDLQTDLENCGACGEICESDLVAVDCREGECVRANCPVGLEYCGAVDLCRDLSSDPEHCGACGNACASGMCSGGVCAPGGRCAAGQTDCGGTCVDTCCNNNHCGACGNVCQAGLTCFEGICDCPSGLCCAEGEVVCNGACVATCCDNNNCGACGNVCTGGETCFEGICGCPSGLCPPVKLPNTGRGTARLETDRDRWAALVMTGAAAASALLWRGSSNAGSARRSEDR